MVTRTERPRPVVLCILDGWGLGEDAADNAIARSRTPVWDRLMATCPHARLETSGRAVGLPAGQMGNSEVGHMNIGAGRVVLQDLPRIDRAFAAGRVAARPGFRDHVARLRATGGVSHLLGLISPGGVHAHQDHVVGLARLLGEAGINVVVHAFLDGRDTPPQSAREYLAEVQAGLAAGARIGTVTGRYYAMDRDRRWDRVVRAYDALALARGEAAGNADQAVAAAYARGESDEFVAPTVIGDFAGMADGDGLLMANFRADRAREILTALLDPEFDGFARPRVPAFATAVGMVEYSTDLNRFLKALFPPQRLENGLGAIVAEAGYTQLRIAETEKYAHVTFFLNGGEERLFPGEERILVPSPKVATYDLAPRMSAGDVTDRLVGAVGSGKFDLIVVNYANADMVGHTGKLAAAITAVETIDQCLGRLADAVTRAGGVLAITADHGNIEKMTDLANDGPHTAHTTNPVPFIIVNPPSGEPGLKDGRLADIAPTLLRYLKLPQPAEMTGRSLATAEPETAPV